MKNSQPKLLRLLSFAQMGKFYSQYGMRALLVLYMIQSLQFSDSRSFGVNALFCGLIELGGIFGGIVADRYLGLRRALLLGAGLLAVGYGCLVLENVFFLALGLIVLGGSLFSGNITAMLGSTYLENDPRRKKGFTLFYMMQNLGALFSTFLCAVIAEKYGFKAGFAVASLGMAAAGLVLFMRRQHLPAQPIPLQNKHSLLLIPVFIAFLGASSLAMNAETVFLPLLPWMTAAFFLFFGIKLLKDPQIPKFQVRKLLVYLGALVLFFAAEDQICSSLIVFAERETERSLFGVTLPSAMLMSINPIVIIMGGSLVARLRFPLIAPFLLVAAAFGALAIACVMQIHLSILAVLGIVAVVSIAELMVGPMVYSFASEVAAFGSPGRVMGMVPLSFALSFLLSGTLSKMVAAPDSYGLGFGKIALLMLFGGVVVHFLMNKWAAQKEKLVA